jgi:hypothetical protein
MKAVTRSGFVFLAVVVLVAMAGAADIKVRSQ